ncbi:MAG: hypothetical protein NCW75_06730 [Phycisphaera sp.]|nr:MAG: hypothetical protein NCW75_06730 [Phycisphaera sp.]
MSTRTRLRILGPIHAVSFPVGDWIFTTLTWLLLALGLLGLAWAMLWDRSRGRKRCPKCWYVVEGVPEVDSATTCPECGKATRKPRKFRKTRRRWGFAALAMIMLAGSYASHAYPIVRDHGWWRAVPDTVLIAMVPYVEEPTGSPLGAPGTDPLLGEVWHRSSTNPSSKHHAWWSAGDLWPWERWLLRHRSRTLLGRASTPAGQQLAARLFTISTDDPVPLTAEAHKGAVALAWSKLRYETCDTYVDVGVFVDLKPYSFRPRFEPDLYPEVFLTAFERGVRIHQEVLDLHLPQKWYGFLHVVWRGPDGQSFLWRRAGDELRPLGYFPSAAPVTHMWEALDPTEHWTSILDHSTDPRLVGVEVIRGRPCYHVRDAGVPPEHATQFWIDVETGVVRQLIYGSGMIHYESTFGAELDPSWYAFDPEHPERSPLMQSLEITNTMLPGHEIHEFKRWGTRNWGG